MKETHKEVFAEFERKHNFEAEQVKGKYDTFERELKVEMKEKEKEWLATLTRFYEISKQLTFPNEFK